VIGLKDALEELGRNIWIDADDIPPGAAWRRELGTGIEAANAFVFVISPDSVASRECAEELTRATDLGKRLVPVLYKNAPGVPEPLTSVQYIDAEDGSDFDRSVKQVDEAIQTDYDWVHAHTAWLARALRWEEGGRDRSLLLRGSELDAAEHWLARQVEGKKPAPTQLQTEYIVAGRDAQRSRLRTIVALTLVALAVSVALGVVALISRNEAIDQRDQARSRELAASAVAQLEVDPERSLLLALEAEEIANSGPADDALRRALVSSHVRAVMPGHRRSIASVDLSRDGERVVTASRDHTARIFDTASGRPLRVLRGHRRPVANASFSPDGRRVVTASDDGTARIWDAADGETLAILHHDRGPVNSAAFSRDRRRIVTAGQDGTARVWKTEDGRQVAVLSGHRQGVASASFDPTGRRVLTAGDDGTARMWNVRSGAGKVVARHERRLFLAKLSDDGRLVLSLDYGGTVRVSASSSGRTVSTLEGMALGATFSPNADSIVTGTIDGPAAVWDTRTGERTAQLVGHGSSVRSAAFSPDGRLVVTGGSDDTARVWDADRGTTVAILEGQRASVGEVAFTPDGQSVITGAEDGSVRRWDVGAGVVLRGHRAPQAPLRGTLGQLGSINSAEASPDGRTVLTAANDGTARLWDIRSGREIIRPQDCGFSADLGYSCLTFGVVSSTVEAGNGVGFLEAAAFSPDGRNVATAGAAGAAFVLDAKSGRQLVSLEGHEQRVFDIAYSRKGDRLVTAGEDDTARVWDASTGRELALLRGHRKDVYAATFTPDGRGVATASEDGTVRLWRVDGGPPRRTLRLRHGAILDVAVSPDGRYLAAPVDQEARIWETDTGRTVARLREHDGLVFSTAFSPDGRTLVTGGQDQTARLWEVPSGRPLGVLRGHNAYLISAEFTPDGRSVVTASDDGTARVFKCDACGSARALMRRARERVTRRLSESERRQFLTFDD
jgi:WD40 repeat protein